MIRPLYEFLSDYREPNGITDYFSDLEKLNDDLLDKPGAYIIFSRKQKFIYPNGRSSIIYIGKTDSGLRKRISSHLRGYRNIANSTKDQKIEAWFYPRYQYMAEFDAAVAWYTLKGLQKAKNLESDLLEKFYDHYWALPVGNGALSFKY